MDNIKQIEQEVAKNSVIPYEDLPKYDLFLSQVTDFLNDKFEDEKYTNSIIQNYIKNGLISKSEDGKKRGYTKNHIVQLILLGYMRPVLTTDEIKKVFNLAFNEINDISDDIISWEKAYKIFVELQEKIVNEFVSIDYFDEATLKEMLKDCNLKKEDGERIRIFLMVMTLIAQASAIKKLAKKIVDTYENK